MSEPLTHILAEILDIVGAPPDTPPDDIPRLVENALAERDALISALPHTADGVPIVADTTDDLLVWTIDGIRGVVALNHDLGWHVWPASDDDLGAHCWPLRVDQCYSKNPENVAEVA